MFVLGAICGIIIGKLNEWFPWSMPFILQCAIGGLIVTIFELNTIIINYFKILMC